MCTSPIRINNNKLDFRPDFMPSFFVVPCGHCHECRQAYIRDWQTRAIAHWYDNVARGGSTYMYTLTYDDEHIPMLNGHKVFCKRDCQLFLKRLRKALAKDGDKFTYLLTSEYGGNTRRPHYHVLLYFSKYHEPLYVRHLIDDAWRNGFVAPCENGGLIQSTKGVAYVAKYILKDSDFDAAGVIDYKKTSSHFLQFLPFHLQSAGFGASIDRFVTNSGLLENKVMLPTGDSSSPFKEYNLPLYNLRRLIYEQYENSNHSVSYRLTAFGKEIRKVNLDRKIRECAETYHRYLDIDLDYILSSDFLRSIGIVDNESLKNYVYESLGGVSLQDLAVYSVVYRGYTDIKSLDMDDYTVQYDRRLNDGYITDYPFLPPDRRITSSIPHVFAGYESALYILSHLKSLIAYENYKEHVIQQNERSMLAYQLGKSDNYKHIDIVPYEDFIGHHHVSRKKTLKLLYEKET